MYEYSLSSLLNEFKMYYYGNLKDVLIDSIPAIIK